MSKFANWLFLLIIGLLPLAGHATCTVTDTSNNPVPNNMAVLTIPGFTNSVNINAPVGAILATNSASLTATTGSKISCTVGGSLEHTGMLNGSIAIPTTISGVSLPVFPTTIPGIGFTATYSPGVPSLAWPFWQGDSSVLQWTVNTQYSLTIQFIKTGPITMGGTLTGEIGGWFAETGKTQVVSIRIGNGIIINPTTPTCQAALPNPIAVGLPNAPVAAFGGVGTTAGTPQSFKISLACSGGNAGTSSRVYVTLTDATNPSNTSDILSATASTASTGVGIRIFNGSTPVKYGPDSGVVGNTNQWQVGTVNAGSSTLDIPLSATYVQKAATVQGGPVSAIATFTLGYN